MLKLENISKYYYTTSNVTCALRKVNLEFKVGEFVAITGESGSGKTTLLNLLSGFDSYEEGEMFYNNKQTSYFDDSDWELYRKNEISFIFQNYNLIESYTVLENVIVSYLISGYSYKEAKEKAKEKIALVGLKNEINKKTIKLSGGQKQRLAIARALAKETNIIVADEPTGNLDEKNGVSVLEVLKKVAKDKLVIIVTHNQAQIEPFITRRIRLHDGEVVADEVIEHVNDDEIIEHKQDEKQNLKKIINFSYLNIKAQPIKSMLLFLLITLCTIASFVFYSNFKANLDENKTKKLSDDIFTNFDDTRLLVRKIDGSVITDEILNGVNSKYITSVEKYDYITDVNYYRPTDYKYIIESEFLDPMNPNLTDLSYYSLEDHSHFMRSSNSLSVDMLKSGRLPENGFEMVVYSNDESLLGKEELVMFHNEKKMGINQRFQYNVKIVGLLKEPTNQAYFSDDICKVIELSQHELNIMFYFRKKLDHVYTTGSITFRTVVIDPNLTELDLSFGKNYVETISIALPQEKNFHLLVGEARKIETYTYKQEATLDVSNSALGVSKEVFDGIYEYYSAKKQFAVYIDDYVNTEDAISELFAAGFDSVSCFNSSVTGYDITKLTERYVNLAISIVALIIINVIMIVISFTILKSKKNDCFSRYC